MARGAHAVLLLDRAGWHTTGNLTIPKNMTLIFLPSRARSSTPSRMSGSSFDRPSSPTCVFDTYEAIIEAACDAWNRLMDQPHAITSIGMRTWAHVGQK